MKHIELAKHIIKVAQRADELQKQNPQMDRTTAVKQAKEEIE